VVARAAADHRQHRQQLGQHIGRAGEGIGGHGIDAARLDDDVRALAVIVSGPGADGWLAHGRSGMRLLRHVGSHQGPRGR
jgi:hypothetical protein